MKRPLRASLVITLASTAVGCARTPPPGNPPPPPTNPPVQQPPSAPPPCPSAAPAPGTSCALAGQRCAYESCGVPDGATATCANGIWDVERVSCNPPPPLAPAR